MPAADQPAERLRGIDKRYFVAGAALGVAAVGAAVYIRRRRQPARGADQEAQSAADGAATSSASSSAEAQPAATPPDQPGNAPAAADRAAAPTADGAAAEPAAPGAFTWHAVSTLHAGGSVHKGADPRWCWSEDEADVIVETAAGGVRSARDVSVKFAPRHLALSVCGERIIDGDLPNAVHADECSWQFEGSGTDRRVVVTLVKALAAVRWDQVVQGA